jgi:MFS family permease
LTLFYDKRAIALRVGYLFVAAAIAGAVGGLIAYGIGFMDSIGGYRAWRWMFIIEGLPPIVVGILFWILMPKDLDTATFLSPEDRAFLVMRRDREVGQTASAQKFHWDDVKEGASDWKVWSFSLAQFGSDTMLYGFSMFLPVSSQPQLCHPDSLFPDDNPWHRHLDHTSSSSPHYPSLRP